MSWFDKVPTNVSQVFDLLSKGTGETSKTVDAGQDIKSTNKTEQTSWFGWLGKSNSTSTPNLNQNLGLNLAAKNINLSNDDIKAQTAREAARIYPAQTPKQSTVAVRTAAMATAQTVQTPERYAGGTLPVTIKPSDTQRTFVQRGLHDHAIKAGLDETEATEFAEKWINKQTSFNKRANGQNTPYSDKEFADLKTKDTADFDLTKRFDAPILADLNRRVDANTIVSEAVAEVAPQIASSVSLDAGKIKNADDALTQYVQNTYNPATESGSRRVWGDKINEMVDAAKQQGVKVDSFELVTDENGKQTANFTVSGANKQKLDDLFGDTLALTIKGEQGSDDGQRQGTKMALDIPITLINGVTKAVQGLGNIPSDLEDLARATRTSGSWATAKIGGIAEVDAQIPKIPDPAPLGEKIMPQVDLSSWEIANQSDMFNKDATGKINPNGQTLGKTASTVTGIAIPIMIGGVVKPASPQTLESIGALPEIESTTTASIAKTSSEAKQVSTGGLRNEIPLTSQQKAEALEYAKSLGIDESNVVFSENMNTSYKLLFGQDRLYIGTDVLPALEKGLPANSRISMRGAIAHELEGHRAAEIVGKTNPNALLEEVQASIRAARFAPNLTTKERISLIRDGLERLQKAGLKVKEVKDQLWITATEEVK